MSDELDIISAGMGVQTTAMIMAAEEGLLPRPKMAIFGDTWDEPKKVYTHIELMRKKTAIPIYTVSTGPLSVCATAVRRSKRSGKTYLKPALPVYFKTRDGVEKGIGQRHCTQEFKIRPVNRLANMARGERRVRMWLGISTDEADRMSVSWEPWMDIWHPLIDVLKWSRADCERYLLERWNIVAPKSSCRYCPFHGDDEWIYLRDHEPDEWQLAIIFERDLQHAYAQTNLAVPYLHPDRVPLDQVALVPGRGGGWGNECRGRCRT
jgi:hypothetical protein